MKGWAGNDPSMESLLKACHYQDQRASQATEGQTPAAFCRGEQLATVLDLDAIRRRHLVRKTYAKGLLSSYELVENDPPEAERRAA